MSSTPTIPSPCELLLHFLAPIPLQKEVKMTMWQPHPSAVAWQQKVQQNKSKTPRIWVSSCWILKIHILSKKIAGTGHSQNYCFSLDCLEIAL